MHLRISLSPFAASLLLALGLDGCSGESSKDGGGGKSFPCTSPTPLVAGQDSGYETCASGFTHRASVVACKSSIPRPSWTCSAGGTCQTDADCSGTPFGHCDSAGNAPCQCLSGCVADSDCAAGQICVCGDPVGQCRTATCKSDADCGSGKLCTSYDSSPWCGSIVFACQTGADECGGDDDCASGEACTVQSGHRACLKGSCVIGRPFLIAGQQRLAGPAGRGDWLARTEVAAEGIPCDLRQRLAAHWETAALMEHASIAAFARFALQLLGLGAPAELVDLTQRALGDEIEHARVCFGLASAYRGRPIGPGQLGIEGAMDMGLDLEAVLRLTVREGCIGETVAAVEAGEAAMRAEDPAIRETLLEISLGEQRHAELAWRFARWALRQAGGALDHVLEDEIAGARREASVTHPPADPMAEQLRAQGVIDEPLRAELRRRVLTEVVAPCASALRAPREPRQEHLATPLATLQV